MSLSDRRTGRTEAIEPSASIPTRRNAGGSRTIAERRKKTSIPVTNGKEEYAAT
jgi:hypothetical protein